MNAERGSWGQAIAVNPQALDECDRLGSMAGFLHNSCTGFPVTVQHTLVRNGKAPSEIVDRPTLAMTIRYGSARISWDIYLTKTATRPTVARRTPAWVCTGPTIDLVKLTV